MEFLAHRIPETGRHQTLEEHSKTVSLLAKKYGAAIGLSSLAELSGLMHDAGKAKKTFQTYLNTNDTSQRGKINHSTAGAKYLMETPSYETSTTEKLCRQILSLTILSHHSGLIDCLDPDGNDIFTNRIFPSSEIHYTESIQNFLSSSIPEDTIRELFQNAICELDHHRDRIKRTHPLSNKEESEETCFSYGLTVRYLLSSLIDADRYDAYCFAAGLKSEDRDYQLSTLWPELIIRLEQYLANFPCATDIEKLRHRISNDCKEFAAHPPGIYRLCVPTGGGKTLSSLRFALEHANNYHKKRIIYVIPYTTIIDQNALVIRDALQNDDIILEHHSNIIYDEIGGDDATGRTIPELLTERWDCPIILTTTVQLLNTLFLGKARSVRRMHNLADSIIIFDEVQTIPVKCLSMFNTALNYLAEICGTTIVLCTATQPELTVIPHPLRLSPTPDIVSNLPELFQQFKRTQIIDACTPKGYSAEQLADFALAHRNGNPSILIIANTTSAARKIHTALQNRMCSEKLYYLTTKLCPAHRKAILEEIRENLNTNVPMICVTTQLIEAGVDISFSCVIRCIAGLDSVAQAAGRCNRHGEFVCKCVYIVNYANEKLSKLPDIQKGKDICERVLGEFERQPNMFGNDLLSPEAVEIYYRYYFLERQNDMNYMVKKSNTGFSEDTTLYKLLSTNPSGTRAYTRKQSVKPQNLLKQAFASAGDLFEVIEQNTHSVIVPYGYGAEIIRLLETSRDFLELRNLIKSSQQYSVNLFTYEVDNLSNGIYPIGDTGAYALSGDCYSDEYGVTSFSDNEPVIL